MANGRHNPLSHLDQLLSLDVEQPQRAPSHDAHHGSPVGHHSELHHLPPICHLWRLGVGLAVGGVADRG